MKTKVLQPDKYEEFKQLFLDVFSNDPWFDKWEDDNQINEYLYQLINNSNSLTLTFIDENDKIIGGCRSQKLHQESLWVAKVPSGNYTELIKQYREKRKYTN